MTIFRVREQISCVETKKRQSFTKLYCSSELLDVWPYHIGFVVIINYTVSRTYDNLQTVDETVTFLYLFCGVPEVYLKNTISLNYGGKCYCCVRVFVWPPV